MLKAFTKIIKNFLKDILGALLNFVWLMLPLGFHVFFVQMREKIDPITVLPIYFSENSTWMAVYDGVVIVNTNPGALRKRLKNIAAWFKKYTYLWITLCVLIITVSCVYVAVVITK